MTDSTLNFIDSFDSFGKILHSSSTDGWFRSEYYSSPWMPALSIKTKEQAMERAYALYEEWKAGLQTGE